MSNKPETTAKPETKDELLKRLLGEEYEVAVGAIKKDRQRRQQAKVRAEADKLLADKTWHLYGNYQEALELAKSIEAKADKEAKKHLGITD